MNKIWSIEETTDSDLIRSMRSSIHNRPQEECWYAVDEYARHWIAIIDGEAVGCASLAHDSKVVSGTVATHRLRWLNVYAEYRRQGIGTGLIQVRLDASHEDGAKFAWSYARLNRVPLYVKLGGVADTHIYDAYGSGDHQDVLYGPLPMQLYSA